MNLQFIKTNLGYLISIVLLICLFFKCENKPIPDTSIIYEKEKRIKTLLSDVTTKEKVIIDLKEKVSENEQNNAKLIDKVKQLQKQKVISQKKIENYDLNELKEFYVIQSNSEDIKQENDRLSFGKVPLDTIAKKLVSYDFTVNERDIYKQAYQNEKQNGTIKDTIINLNQWIINDLKQVSNEKDGINQELKNQLKKANKPKIGKYAILVGAGILTGMLIK